MHAFMGACQPLCRKKKNRVISLVVTYRAYPQISKMADNLRFQMNDKKFYCHFPLNSNTKPGLGLDFEFKARFVTSQNMVLLEYKNTHINTHRQHNKNLLTSKTSSKLFN